MPKKGYFGLRIEDTKTQTEIYFKFRNPQSTIYNQKTPPPLPESGAFFLLLGYKPCYKLLLTLPENLSWRGSVACGIGKVCSLIGFFVVFDQIARFLHIVVVPFF